jgi:hypothetical protein
MIVNSRPAGGSHGKLHPTTKIVSIDSCVVIRKTQEIAGKDTE